MILGKEGRLLTQPLVAVLLPKLRRVLAEGSRRGRPGRGEGVGTAIVLAAAEGDAAGAAHGVLARALIQDDFLGARAHIALASGAVYQPHFGRAVLVEVRNGARFWEKLSFQVERAVVYKIVHLPGWGQAGGRVLVGIEVGALAIAAFSGEVGRGVISVASTVYVPVRSV